MTVSKVQEMKPYLINKDKGILAACLFLALPFQTRWITSQLPVLRHILKEKVCSSNYYYFRVVTLMEGVLF